MQETFLFAAHINENGDIQTIKQHLLGTAQKAQKFADEFGCGEAAYLCGLLHDIGKYSKSFQTRVRDPHFAGKVDHSTAGAVEIQKLASENIPLGMVIAGHHSGLLDYGNAVVSSAGDGTFIGRCKKTLEDYSAWENELHEQLSEYGRVNFPPFCKENRYKISFFTRMIYSCLVDADYLDTEQFMNHGQNLRTAYETMEKLNERFGNYIAPWLENESAQTEILGIYRNNILRRCLAKGEAYARGIYTLTVPTGGGKTTASMGFALRHACRYGMKRIIYVIPYTSVIDQNAAVFKNIFGEENVLEHHSGIIYDMDESESGEKQYRKVLATENWDVPIVVTTAVQFFESLYSNRSSKCRKLHNIANSIIIFDEAQTLPVPYLEPCVAAMAELAENYRSTVVLCTATQPAIEKNFYAYVKNKDIREICCNPENLFEVFRRTNINDIGEITEESLAERLQEQNQVLCIVNTRKLARLLYQKLEGEGSYCLTTLLCPNDRKKKFAEIKKRLMEKKPCRVVATSLLEAGVDLDFPQVYRQEAGLDSLIQAAGRCNREGKRPPEERNVYSFRIEAGDNRYIRQQTAALKETWRRYRTVDTPAAIAFYFQYYREDILGKENLDNKEILKAFEKGINGCYFPFATVGKQFQLIENEMRTVYVPSEETEALLKEIADSKADRNTYRKLGQYGVNVYEEHFRRLKQSGCIEDIGSGTFVLRDGNQYESDIGLSLDVETGYGILV